MLEPFRVNVLRMARSARMKPEVRAVSELDSLLPRAEVVYWFCPLPMRRAG